MGSFGMQYDKPCTCRKHEEYANDEPVSVHSMYVERYYSLLLQNSLLAPMRVPIMVNISIASAPTTIHPCCRRNDPVCAVVMSGEARDAPGILEPKNTSVYFMGYQVAPHSEDVDSYPALRIDFQVQALHHGWLMRRASICSVSSGPDTS